MFSYQTGGQPLAPAEFHNTAPPALARGRLHEIHADEEDWAAALGFALAATATSHTGPIVMVRPTREARMRGMPYGEGLAWLGIDPARMLIVETRDERELLRAGHDAARHRELAAVVLQTSGPLPGYDLTVSRRLVLAAEHSGVGIVMLRGGAPPRASAAHSRWLIRSAPSVPLAARAPGLPAIEAELLRLRGGQAGMRWRLEWDNEHGCFREDRTREDRARKDQANAAIPAPGATRAPLSGAVVPLAGLRAGEAHIRAA